MAQGISQWSRVADRVVGRKLLDTKRKTMSTKCKALVVVCSAQEQIPRICGCPAASSRFPYPALKADDYVSYSLWHRLAL